MNSKYDIEINNDTILMNLDRMQSQIFKCLPMKEEGKDWRKPLETVSLELLGMHSLFPQSDKLLSLVCKLEGLLEKNIDEDFQFYRRTIFECCGLIDKIKVQI